MTDHLYFDWNVCKCLHSVDHHSIGPDGISFMCIVINMTTHKQCNCRFVVDRKEAYTKLKSFYKDMIV